MNDMAWIRFCFETLALVEHPKESDGRAKRIKRIEAQKWFHTQYTHIQYISPFDPVVNE